MESSVEGFAPPAYSCENFAELRRNLPREHVEPSAPMYTIETIEGNEPNREQISLLRTAPDTAETEESLEMMQAELDVKKAKLKREQLEKQKQLIVEDFMSRIEVVDTEVAVALSKLQSLKETCNQPKSAQLIPGSGSVNGRLCLPSPQREDGRSGSVNPAYSGTPAAMIRPPVLNYTAPSFLGLEQLRVLDCLVVKQLRAVQNMAEVYEVIAPGEELVIFHVIVQVGVAEGAPTQRITRIKFIDSEDHELMVFRGNQDGCSVLQIGGKLACFVTKPHTYFKSKLLIHDQFKKQVLKVKGPNIQKGQNVFHLQTNNKDVIGKLTKKVGEISENHGPSYAVMQFPLDLDVRYKAAFLACNFLIVEDNIIALRNQKFKASTLRLQRSILQYPSERHLGNV